MRTSFILLLVIPFAVTSKVQAQASDKTHSESHYIGTLGNIYRVNNSDATLETKRKKIVKIIADDIQNAPADGKNFDLIRDAINLSLAEVDSLIAMIDTAAYRSPYKRNADFTRKRIAVAETGKRFPPLTLTDTSGRPFPIDSLLGKVVLIDVWSSWCGPCRAQIPDLVKVYDKYHNDGFEMVGVSFDNDKAAWLKAIAKDKQTWRHFSELTNWNNNKFSERFSIMGIPSNFLLDKDGIILGQDLSPDQVKDLVKEKLSRK